MPEGDSIWNLAAKLQPLVGREVVAFTARKLPAADTKSLVGRTVTKVEARGKNLLIRFDDERVLHVHLRMEGRLFAERPRSAFYRPRTTEPDLRLAVRGVRAIVGTKLPVLRVLRPKQAARADDLASLGPDLCDPSWDAAEALRRFRALGDRAIADALLVQRAAAGIGNVYKSEVCFLERVAPAAMLSAVSDDVLLALLRRASALLRQNLRPGPRTTRAALRGPRLWVYNRAHRPCFECGTPIQRFMQGPSPGRSTYWCPRCQPLASPA
ncbi:MAG: Fpg/Nei family DNA glycosylase [Labilithrix sp.]|nr:Fpg/Nei family DNA glycosylase [Labilithrix sp.]MCW5814795.1 Fpg/Nei family DNA glycosylase [Labilithrix sp.]